MKDISVVVEKGTPDIDGNFTVTLKAWHQGEEFTQALDNKTYTEETWAPAEYRSRSSEFVWNIRAQFE